MKWRVVGTDSESMDGVTSVCEERDPNDPSSPAHAEWDVQDCCAGTVVLQVIASENYYREDMAVRLAAALTTLDIDEIGVCD